MEPDRVQATLIEQGQTWWRQWDARSIIDTCDLLPSELLYEWPAIAFWRGLGAAMVEDRTASAYLELAYEGYERAGFGAACRLVSQSAIVLGLLDPGGMSKLALWRKRAQQYMSVEGGPRHMLWDAVGAVVLPLIAPTVAAGSSTLASAWLREQLGPLKQSMSADERLLVAQVLVNHYLHINKYDQFDMLENAVEVRSFFDAASPLMRSRWHYSVGFAWYQIGQHGLARRAWSSAINIADAENLPGTRLLTRLAEVRLAMDSGHLDEAQKLLDQIKPTWGDGRESLVVLYTQMKGRLKLVQGHYSDALELLKQALLKAHRAGVPYRELASCQTDLVQAFIATGKVAKAHKRLEVLIRRHDDRDSDVFRSLYLLHRARVARETDEGASKDLLGQGLRLAQARSYSWFFRLLPALALELCRMAQEWNVEWLFVRDAIQVRGLKSPPHFGSDWPWPVWVQTIGDFSVRIDGVWREVRGKDQKATIELLMLLATHPNMSLPIKEALAKQFPGVDAESAKMRLDVRIKRLRLLLNGDSRVLVAGQIVSLNPGIVNSDLHCRTAIIAELERFAVSSEKRDERRVGSLIEQIILLGVAAPLGAVPAGSLPWQPAVCQESDAALLKAAHFLRQIERDHLSITYAGEKLLRHVVSLGVPKPDRVLVTFLVECLTQHGRLDEAKSLWESHFPSTSSIL